MSNARARKRKSAPFGERLIGAVAYTVKSVFAVFGQTAGVAQRGLGVGLWLAAPLLLSGLSVSAYRLWASVVAILGGLAAAAFLSSLRTTPAALTSAWRSPAPVWLVVAGALLAMLFAPAAWLLAAAYGLIAATALVILVGAFAPASESEQNALLAQTLAKVLNSPGIEPYVRVNRRGVGVVRPAPASALLSLDAHPGEIDVAFSSVFPGIELVLAPGGRSILIQEASPETIERRETLRSSGGLVVSMSRDGDTTTFTLADGFRGSSVDDLTGWLAGRGLALQRIDLASRTAIARPADPRADRLRDAAAQLIGCRPHEIELSTSTDPAGRIDRVDVARYPIRGLLEREKRTALWRQIAATAIPAVEGARWRVEDHGDRGAVTLARFDDPLTGLIRMADFDREHFDPHADPASSWRRFPIALREDLALAEQSFFHTLVVGQTGAGKGSVVWSILHGILPAARAGLAEIWAIDPKGAEVIVDGGQTNAVFARVATDPEAWAELIGDLVSVMDARKGRGRSLDVTQADPLLVLFIDELSALTILDTDRTRSAQTQANLLKILSQGRSLNVLVIGALQAPQKSMVGPFRDFMPMRVALRTGTAIETDLVLGDGATDAGAEAHMIPVAGPGNGYATAGVGYVRVEGEPDPVRVRFPYTDDALLSEWHSDFVQLRLAGALKPQSNPATAQSAQPKRPIRTGDILPDEPDAEPIDLTRAPIDLGDLFS